MPLSAGKDFKVVTVSFDPRETPELAAAKKKNYVGAVRPARRRRGWHFLTGKAEAIERLTGAVGFRYVYDAQQDQYIHTSGIVVLTPQRQDLALLLRHPLPGRDLRLGLVEASAGKIGSPERPGAAVLLPLRSGHGKVLRQRHELRARGRRADGRRADRHGVVPAAAAGREANRRQRCGIASCGRMIAARRSPP